MYYRWMREASGRKGGGGDKLVVGKGQGLLELG